MYFGTTQGTLGDSLWITPLLNAFPSSVLKMYDTPTCRNVSQIFEGLLSRVEFCENPHNPPLIGMPPAINAPVHYSQRMLMAAGKPNESAIPKIKLRKEEIEWARQHLSRLGNIDRMVVIHTHNSGWANSENWFARHLKPPIKMMEWTASVAKANGYEALQFCNDPWPNAPDNFDPLPNTKHIRGLTLRQTAACYHVIGRMISGDTGDPYLALSVGAKVIWLMAKEIEWTGYRWHNVQYVENMWMGENNRARYHSFEDWVNSMNGMAFLFDS
jgi:hypothetical protein